MPIVATYDAPSTTIEVTGGTSGVPATWNDIYLADVAGGWGVVTEVVTDAMYKCAANLDVGDGSTATHFTSLNEMVYFEDSYAYAVTAAATLQLGELVGDWGVNGSTWSAGPSALMPVVATASASWLVYASKLEFRTNQIIRVLAGTTTFKNVIMGWMVGSSGTSRYFYHLSGNGNYSDVFLSNCQEFRYSTVPTLDGFHVHDASFGVEAGDGTLVGLRTSEVNASLRTGNSTVVSVDTVGELTALITGAAGNIAAAYKTNIHVNDRDGANLATATVACTSYGNIVSNDAGANFYKCIVDHTAGTFATDLAAGKWELFDDADILALAGGKDADGNPTPIDGTAQNGAWVTGIDYVAAAQQFSQATDAAGDIAEQTVDFKKWIGTSEALLSYSPHTFAITKATYEPQTHDSAPINAPTSLRFELLPLLLESNVLAPVEYSEDKTGTFAATYASADDVRDGTDRGDGTLGNMALTTVGNLLLGVGIGTNATEIIGTHTDTLSFSSEDPADLFLPGIINTALLTSGKLAGRLGPHDFGSGTATPGIFTNDRVLYQARRPLIYIEQSGFNASEGDRAARSYDSQVAVQVWGNRGGSDLELYGLAQEAWAIIDRLDLTLAGWTVVNFQAQSPDRIRDELDFPGYEIIIEINLMQAA